MSQVRYDQKHACIAFRRCRGQTGFQSSIICSKRKDIKRVKPERPDLDMNFAMRPEMRTLLGRVNEMIRDEVMPLEADYHAEIGKGDRWAYTDRQADILNGLKAKAKAAGLWNFWLTDSENGIGLTTVEYAYFAEEMGKTPLGAEVFNCSAPDTGNMEVRARDGT